ncbi:hypothetical protein CLOP_g20568 [Closterium sp. NIES-67]|nr:hypothetical protein CLOP_g20568 [Closterium sp. NIES-67]
MQVSERDSPSTTLSIAFRLVRRLTESAANEYRSTQNEKQPQQRRQPHSSQSAMPRNRIRESRNAATGGLLLGIAARGRSAGRRSAWRGGRAHGGGERGERAELWGQTAGGGGGDARGGNAPWEREAVGGGGGDGGGGGGASRGSRGGASAGGGGGEGGVAQRNGVQSGEAAGLTGGTGGMESVAMDGKQSADAAAVAAMPPAAHVEAPVAHAMASATAPAPAPTPAPAAASAAAAPAAAAADSDVAHPGRAAAAAVDAHVSAAGLSSSSDSALPQAAAAALSVPPGTAPPLPIRQDWGRNVSLQQKEAEEHAKVESGACSEFKLVYRGGWREGQLTWAPQPDRFVLMDCHKHQLSNRVRCMRHSMIAAGMLNRTLVVPMCARDVPRHYDRHAFLHLAHTQRCYGPLSVISWDGAGGNGTLSSSMQTGNGSASSSSSSSSMAVIDQVICIREPCYNQPGWGSPDHLPDLPGLSYSPNLTITTVTLPPGTIDTRAFTNLSSLIPPSARIILLGDLAALNLEGPRGMDVPFFTRPGCPNTLAIHPHPAILEAADRFVSSVILPGKKRWWERDGDSGEGNTGESKTTETASSPGSLDSSSESSRASNKTLWAVGNSTEEESVGVARYIAVHWRRTDLVRLSKDPWVHLPVARVGKCLVQRMALSGNITRMFLATDAEQGEVNELVHFIKEWIPSFQLLRLPETLDSHPWADVINPLQFEDAVTVRATLDKAICAMADVFQGTHASSFSEDIKRIRAGLRLSSCEDSLLCEDMIHS